MGTIDIYYLISIDKKSIINYNFYRKDFEIWKGLFKFHVSDIDKWSLYSIDGVIRNINNIDNMKNNKEYYIFSLESNELNLYNKMRWIPYLYDEEEKIGEKIIDNVLWIY